MPCVDSLGSVTRNLAQRKFFCKTTACLCTRRNGEKNLLQAIIAPR